MASLHSTRGLLFVFTTILLFLSTSAPSSSDNRLQIPFQWKPTSLLSKAGAFEELTNCKTHTLGLSEPTEIALTNSAERSINSNNRIYHHDFVVLRFLASTDSERRILKEITHKRRFDVWSSTREHIDICLQEKDIPKLFSLLPYSLQKSHLLLIPHVQVSVNQTWSHISTSKQSFNVKSLNETYFSNYQSLDTIYIWMDFLRALYPDLVDIIELGNSYEGRKIQGIKLNGTPPKEGKKKKTILINGAQHAREWISVSTVSYLASALVSGYNQDNDIKNMLDDFDWVFFPTLNVDGYVYSFEVDRLWRKNRQPTGFPFCTGIDLNRDWGFKWPEEEDSLGVNPCSERYQGETPFQAIESKLLAEYIGNLKDHDHEVIGYLDFHSYAQKILYPFAYDCATTPPNLEDLEELAIGAARAIKQSNYQHYEVESACDYDDYGDKNGGSAVDWIYNQGAHFSYIIKLRDTGTHGFLLPPDEIIPCGEEILSMTKFFSKFISEKEGFIH
ncbi:putative metallocarboxypeptidase ECM14 [Neolecta irregularis DAH-3]|uniref:Inactive metallocarboxypeptidase ECM14 n=1 Tax=Neolecta irregularis (strain DAH-3) TaxID=1198029 RepID=A0A1U7LM12_NEOID|nr:putative metallocarboxypeptidase ECM14 [Neolecta irregularis DAH-3]|eukprot:OLL23582.1 putative metallocarboxypeptidase ECM14 [Neolecta irregularis DAH-3]